MPSFTFVSTANAVVLRGGVPVFVDIREDTLNMDERLVERAITDRTRAIMAVHYAGVGCAPDTLADLAGAHDIVLIEDAAQALLASHAGRPLGSFGALAALSFHETKNVLCGEGGALLVNDPELIERAEIIQEKGTNRLRYFRGQVDKYSWVDIGSSYAPSEINAAFLWAQLEDADAITQRRLEVWEAYHAAFADLEASGRVRRPIIPPEARHNAHLYYLLLPSLEDRTLFISELAGQGIHSVFHYVPLHTSEAGRRYGRTAGTLEITERVGDRLVRLPLWPDLGPTELEDVIDTVRTTLGRMPTLAARA
jgi:dTDP-4-amino-4,6-dideoxygalactose transaminase